MCCLLAAPEPEACHSQNAASHDSIRLGTWVSGLALAIVFPTCAAVHAIYATDLLGARSGNSDHLAAAATCGKLSRVAARHNRADRLATVIVVLLLVAPLTGCGDDNSSSAPTAQKREPLPAVEQETVREARSEIQSYCRELTLYLARRRGPPTEEEAGRVYGAVDRLAAIARAQPSGTQGSTGGTIRDLLGDIAEDLQGSHCADNVVARIDQALGDLPAE
jgi:hypothetical protein